MRLLRLTAAIMPEPHGKSMLLVLAVACALRVLTPLAALATARPGPLIREPDSVGYLQVAEQLADTGQVATEAGPEIVRTPGYPLLLAIGVLAGQVDAVTIGLQVMLSSLTIWLVYRLGLLLGGGRPAALAGAWLLASEPLSVLYAGKLLSETLFTTLITCAAWFTVRYARELRWRDALATAVAVAAAAYVRPIACYLPLALAIVGLTLVFRRTPSRGRLAGQLAVFLLVAMGLLGLWRWRNQRLADYAGFSAIADVNLYYYQAVPVLAELEGVPPERLPDFQRKLGFHDRAAWLRVHPDQRDWSAARRYAFLRAEAWRVLRAHPLIAMRLHVEGVAHTLFDSGRNAWVDYFRLLPASEMAPAGGLRPASERLMAALRNKPLVVAIHAWLALTLALYLGLAVLGLARGVRQRNALLLPLLALLAYFLLLSGGPAGYHRFRLPIEPLLCLLAGEGWSAIAEAYRRRRSG